MIKSHALNLVLTSNFYKAVTMHIVIITPKFIPNKETGGAALYNFSLIHLLLKQKHRVTLIHFDCLKHNAIYPKAAKDLEDMGVKVISFATPMPLSKIRWTYQLEDSFPAIQLASQVVPFLQESKPDLVFCYGEDGFGATQGLTCIPLAVQLGDPIHLIRLIRWQYDIFWGYPFGFNLETIKWPWRLLYSGTETLPGVWSYPRNLQTLLKDVSLTVTVIPQQVDRYEQLTGKKCYFTPIPLPDTTGPDWEEKRRTVSVKKDGRAKILWVGKLGNTENRYAVSFFVRELYPELVKKLGKENFEVHFIGNSRNCPSELIRLAETEPHLYIRGHVPDIDYEFLSADVYLVTNTTTLGARTRIISSFSNGSCVVAHIANTIGIPALKHRENALIGRNAKEIADLVAEAILDPELRLCLGRNGRRVFEEQYQEDVSAQMLIDLFEKTIRAFSEQRKNTIGA